MVFLNIDFRYHELMRMIGWHDLLFGHDRPKKVFKKTKGDDMLSCKIHFMISEMISDELERRRNDPRDDYVGEDEEEEC